MLQFYKDFLLNGTRDRAFSSVLDKDITGNINNFIFGENSGDRIRGIITDYSNEIKRNKIARVIDSKFGLEWVLDSFTRMNGSELEFYTNADKNEDSLFTISSMQSLLEINDYTDLIAGTAVAENEEVDISKRFKSFKMFNDLLRKTPTSPSSGDHRVYTQRMQIDIPGETNCYIYKIQSRVIISNTRVVYNHYCVLRNDMDYSIELLDNEYNLGILKENNKTIKYVYKYFTDFKHIVPFSGRDLEEINQCTSDKFTFALCNVLNKNQALYASLEAQLNHLERRFEDGVENFNVNHRPLRVSADIIKEFAKGLYTLNKNLSLKELDIAFTTILAVAVNFNVAERNLTYKAIDIINSTSSKDIKNIIKLCLNNIPETREDIENYNYGDTVRAELAHLKAKKISEVEKISRDTTVDLFNELWKLLVNFKVVAKDIIIKSMYEENIGLHFQAPRDQEDRITMLTAVKSIEMISLEERNKLSLEEVDAASLLKLNTSSRRLSNAISNTAYLILLTEINKLIGLIKVEARNAVDVATEKVVNEIDELTVSDALRNNSVLKPVVHL